MPLSDKLEQLQTALVFCTIGKTLRKAAYWSIGWGALLLVIGAAVSYARVTDYPDLVIGTALVAEGIYLMVTRKAWAVLVEGTTLAALACWHIWGFVAAYKANGRVVGNPIGIIVLLVAAWSMFSTYRSYKLACEKAEPSSIQVCKEQLDTIAQGKAGTVIFMQQDKALESSNTWVASFVDDAILFVKGPKEAFRKKINPTEGVWVARKDVRLENTGDAWIGGKIKARLYVKEAEFLKVKLGREDFERLNDLLLGRAAVTLG